MRKQDPRFNPYENTDVFWTVSKTGNQYETSKKQSRELEWRIQIPFTGGVGAGSAAESPSGPSGITCVWGPHHWAKKEEKHLFPLGHVKQIS